MGTEIERKFLVDFAKVRPYLSGGEPIEQGYLVNGPVTLRVRCYGQKAVITVKGPGSISRAEFEMVIPIEYGKVLLQQCPTAIRKKRYHIGSWEVDVFENVLDPEGAHSRLVVAEIELSSESQKFETPEWLLGEVTYNPCYTNAYLSTQVIRTADAR